MRVVRSYPINEGLVSVSDAFLSLQFRDNASIWKVISSVLVYFFTMFLSTLGATFANLFGFACRHRDSGTGRLLAATATVTSGS